MIERQDLRRKIERLPSELLEEVSNYIDYIEFRKDRQGQHEIKNITLASEKALQDWLRPEEDEAWEHL